MSVVDLSSTGQGKPKVAIRSDEYRPAKQHKIDTLFTPFLAASLKKKWPTYYRLGRCSTGQQRSLPTPSTLAENSERALDFSLWGAQDQIPVWHAHDMVPLFNDNPQSFDQPVRRY